jgi:nucleotide-binding universal stress UspA family protein
MQEVRIMLKVKRILVAVDFSAESDLALDWAVRLANEEVHASIDLVHVLYDIITPLHTEAQAYENSDHFQLEKRAAQKQLEKMRARIPPPIASSALMGRGHVPQEIARICKARNTDLVVMTTRARRGFSRILRGSIAEETVRLAPCPVLVLHMNQAAQPAKVACS